MGGLVYLALETAPQQGESKKESELRSPFSLLLLMFAELFPQPQLNAGPITIDFEGLPDLQPVSTQYHGLMFMNATVLTAGISLNEFEFPPHSGTNVLFDDGGPISISFAAPVLSFSGFFTYLAPVILTAYDALDNEVAVALSAFTNNTALSGDPGSSPNELLNLLFDGGISRVTIAGDPFGGSLTADDLAFTAVPEPVTATLVSFAVGTLLFAAPVLRRR